MKLKSAATWAALGAVICLTPNRARADVVAAYAEGHGGFENTGSAIAAPNASSPGLGFRLGARVLVFEGYYDNTGFGDGAAVSRSILGLRGGLGSRDVRLVLRAGAGILDEEGGALTGRAYATPERRGVVGRIGAAVEGRIAPMLLLGLGVDGETFALPSTGGPSTVTGTSAVTGSDIFANLHLMFELGV